MKYFMWRISLNNGKGLAFLNDPAPQFFAKFFLKIFSISSALQA